MSGRILRYAILAAAIAVMVALSLTRVGSISTFSSYDTGENGYQAFYNVLRAEGVEVGRAREPLGIAIKDARVWVVTSSALDSFGGAYYDKNELSTLADFVKSGGRVVAFVRDKRTEVSWLREKFKPIVFLADDYTNAALEKHPQRMRRAYDAIAGRGAVLVDERIHGYGNGRTLWSALPDPVRQAVWLVAFALAIVFIEGNVRFAPPIVRESPSDRDSSDYIMSMATLLRRARTPHPQTTTMYLAQRKERS